MAILKKVLNAVLIVAVLGALVFFVFFNKETKAANGHSEQNSQADPATATQNPATAVAPQKDEAAPLPVRAVMAQKMDFLVRVKSPGEAFTEQKVVIKAETGGVIRNFNIAEGKHLRDGDLLLQLDERAARLNLDKAQAMRLKYLSELLLEKQFKNVQIEPSNDTAGKLTEAKSKLDKAAARFSQGMISQADLDKARLEYELVLIESGSLKEEIQATAKNFTQAEIDAKVAQMELDKTRILAPFAGIVTDIKVSPRERVAPGQDLFTLVNVSRIKVRARVLESEIGRMKIGRAVSLRFSAYPSKTYNGALEAVSPIVNPDDKTCSVYIAVNNPNEEIKPGMHAETEIATEIDQGRLLVPQSAVLVRQGRKLVFVVEGDLAIWRYIETGLENEEYVEVLQGVRAGEMVITEGHFTLAHQTKITLK